MRFLESTQYPALIILSFLLSTSNRNTYFQATNQYFVVSEQKRQAVTEQTRFLSTVFLCSGLENIYSGVNFCGKNVCGNFYLRELNYFYGSHEKPQIWQKLEPAKISYHTVDLQRCPLRKCRLYMITSRLPFKLSLFIDGICLLIT